MGLSGYGYTEYAAWIPREEKTIDKVIDGMLADGDLTYQEADQILDVYNDHNWQLNDALRKALSAYGYDIQVSRSMATFTKRKKKRLQIPKIQVALGKHLTFVIILMPTIILCSLRLLGVI